MRRQGRRRGGSGSSGGSGGGEDGKDGKGGERGGSGQETGGGSGEDGGKGGGSGGDSDGGKGGRARDSGLKPLAKSRLSAALLKSADVPGYRVRATDDVFDDDEGDTPKAGPECEPLIDVFSRDTERKRSAWAAGSVLRGGQGELNTQASMHQVLLAAYGEDEGTRRRSWAR